MGESIARRRSLSEGIRSLVVLQAADYVVPLLALPYLLRVIGADGFGHIAFAQAFGMYFVVVTEYGFNLTANRLASIHRDEKKTLSRIFWEVQCIKFAIGAVSFVLLVLLVWLLHDLRTIAPLMFIGFLPVIGTIMYPLWLLQGTERMREAAGLMILSRLLMLAGVFLLVKGPDDTLIAGALQMGAMPLAGILSWSYLRKWRLIEWARPSRDGLRLRVRDSWHAFVATGSSTLYRSSNAVVLGFLSVPSAVAYYSLAEKMVRAVQELARPVNQAAYPRVSALAAQSHALALPLLRKLLLLIGVVSFAASSTLFVLAEELVRFVAGGGFERAAHALRFMAFNPFVGGINSILGVLTMMPFGFSRQFSRYVALVGLFNLVAIVPLVLIGSERGAALSFFLSELLLLWLMWRYLRRQGVRYA